MSVSTRGQTGHFKFLVALIVLGSTAATVTSAGNHPLLQGFPVPVPENIVVRVQDSGTNDGVGTGNEGGGVAGYGGSDEGYSGDEGGGVNVSSTSGAASLAAKTPQAIGQALHRAAIFCDNLPGTEYAIDCIAYEYWEIQKQLPDYGETSDIKKVLKETSKKLRKLAADNSSPTKRPARVSQGNRKFSRALIPVDRRKLPALKREAVAIINNGATLLIRASGDSNRKRAQYQQIAKSMQTGAIMLRSL